MPTVGREPSRVRLEIAGESHSAEALELTGHRAAVRSPHAVVCDVDVRLVLDWCDGTTTALPGVVRAVAPSGREQLAHLELTGVEGAWEPFLAFLGPSLIVA